MGELEPIGPEAALVRELRTLFDALDVSQNRYAARVYLDKSVLSRYLSGERIPRWDFVHRLLVESTMKHHGIAPTHEVVKHLRTLHHAALEAGGSPNHRIQLLQEQLAEADAQEQRADRRERELEADLQAVQRQAAELEVRCRELENALDAQNDDHGAAVALLHHEANAERSALIAEIQRLTRELELAHQRRLAAEARCEELEHQLELDPEETRQPTATVHDPGSSWPPPLIDGAGLNRMRPEDAADILARQSTDGAVTNLLAEMLDKRLRLALYHMNDQEVAWIFGLLATDRASQMLGTMEAGQVRAVLEKMPLARIVPVAELLPMDRRAFILSAMDSGRLADVVETLEAPRGAIFLSNVGPERSADVLELMKFDQAVELFAAMSKLDDVFAGDVMRSCDSGLQDRLRAAYPK